MQTPNLNLVTGGHHEESILLDGASS